MWLPDSSIGVQKQQIPDAMIFITKRTLTYTAANNSYLLAEFL